MKPKIKIVVSKYHYNDVTERMLDTAKEHYVNSNLNFDVSHVPGSFEIPFEIARSIKEDTIRNEDSIGSFKQKGIKEIRDNIVQMAKLSQLNLDNQSIFSGYLALGCVIKGKTINHEAISTSIFTNLQRISIENVIPIGNAIFNANNLKEAKEKCINCTSHAINTLSILMNLKNEKK